MSKYNPTLLVITENDVAVSANLDLIKNFLAHTGVSELAAMSAEEVEHLGILIADTVGNRPLFSDVFCDTGIVYYNRTHTCPLYRDDKHLKGKKPNWADKEILDPQRKYIYRVLLPSCRKKFVDMMSGQAWAKCCADAPTATVKALNGVMARLTICGRTL